ncbi:MAG: tetratricopeptide repeat protein [bacterium]
MDSPAPARRGTRSRLRPSIATASGLIERGLAEFYREREDEALGLFLEALEYSPDDLRAHYLAALCAQIVTREDTLEQLCSHARELDRRNPWTRACEGIRYLFLANFSRAEDLIEGALAELPDRLELILGLGVVHEYSGERDKGVAACRRALEREPDNVRALVSLGGFYAMDGEYDSALALYSRAREVAPDIENPHQKLGRDYYHEGMIEQAAGEFARAVNDEPDEPAGHFYLLDCLRRLNRSDDAIDLYGEIAQRFGDSPELTSGFYEHFNMRPEAIAALERLAREEPDDPDVLARLSRAYCEAGRLDDAARTARRLTRLVPEDAGAIAMLGDLHLRRGHLRLAISSSRRAIRLDPNAQQAYVTLADALLFLGRQDESWHAICEMERIRREAWEAYQARFSGQDCADTGN